MFEALLLRLSKRANLVTRYKHKQYNSYLLIEEDTVLEILSCFLFLQS
jgi:hypothetical protein